MVLLPKVNSLEDSTDIQKFHLSLEFPEEVNHISISDLLDKVLFAVAFFLL